MYDRIIGFLILIVMIVAFATITTTMITDSNKAAKQIAKTILNRR